MDKAHCSVIRFEISEGSLPVGKALSGCSVDNRDVMRLEGDTKQGGAIEFTYITESERSAVKREETVSRISGALKLCDSRVS